MFGITNVQVNLLPLKSNALLSHINYTYHIIEASYGHEILLAQVIHCRTG